MNNKVLLLSLCFFLSVLACRAQHIGDYVLNISKINQDEANMHVSCSFVIDFQKSDSIVMNFGGDGMLSVENLTIQTDTSSLKFSYQPDARKLVFKKIQGRNIGVKMNYNYTNLSAFFITSVRKIILSRLCCNGLNPFLRNSCLQPKITILFVRITAI